MKIAIFGIGFLGANLMKSLSYKFEVIGASKNPKNKTIKSIDATDINAIEQFLIFERPDIVINTIALSSYFLCEKNPSLCNSLNYDTANNIANICRKINSKLIFISSSYVFNGEKGNYNEVDITNSTNKYAISKIRAEKMVLRLKDSIVIRIEPLYGYDVNESKLKVGTNNFEKDILIGYPNIVRNPVYINDISIIIERLIKRKQKGIFHIAGPRKLKWIDFIKNLASVINAEDKITIVDNSSWILKPPQDSSLDISKINSLGIMTTSFENALNELNGI